MATKALQNYFFTDHAKKRMLQRGIKLEMAEKAVLYGRKIHKNGVQYYVIGRKEIKKYNNVDLKALNGIHIVVNKKDDNYIIITAYRNKNLQIRPT